MSKGLWYGCLTYNYCMKVWVLVPRPDSLWGQVMVQDDFGNLVWQH